MKNGWSRKAAEGVRVCPLRDDFGANIHNSRTGHRVGVRVSRSLQAPDFSLHSFFRAQNVRSNDAMLDDRSTKLHRPRVTLIILTESRASVEAEAGLTLSCLKQRLAGKTALKATSSLLFWSFKPLPHRIALAEGSRLWEGICFRLCTIDDQYEGRLVFSKRQEVEE